MKDTAAEDIHSPSSVVTSQQIDVGTQRHNACGNDEAALVTEVVVEGVSDPTASQRPANPAQTGQQRQACCGPHSSALAPCAEIESSGSGAGAQTVAQPFEPAAQRAATSTDVLQLHAPLDLPSHSPAAGTPQPAVGGGQCGSAAASDTKRAQLQQHFDALYAQIMQSATPQSQPAASAEGDVRPAGNRSDDQGATAKCGAGGTGAACMSPANMSAPVPATANDAHSASPDRCPTESAAHDSVTPRARVHAPQALLLPGASPLLTQCPDTPRSPPALPTNFQPQSAPPADFQTHSAQHDAHAGADHVRRRAPDPPLLHASGGAIAAHHCERVESTAGHRQHHSRADGVSHEASGTAQIRDSAAVGVAPLDVAVCGVCQLEQVESKLARRELDATSVCSRHSQSNANAAIVQDAGVFAMLQRERASRESAQRRCRDLEVELRETATEYEVCPAVPACCWNVSNAGLARPMGDTRAWAHPAQATHTLSPFCSEASIAWRGFNRPASLIRSSRTFVRMHSYSSASSEAPRSLVLARRR